MMDTKTLYELVIVVLAIFMTILYFYYKNKVCVLKLHNTQLKQLSQYDDLTQIFNRRYFLEIVHYHFKIIHQKNSSAIMMIDIDNFKKINDTYGHLVGDDVLKYTVKQISENLREDDILARYGGDEFIVFFPCISKKDIHTIAARIQSKLEEHKTYDFPVTLSMEICVFSTLLPLINVIQYADNALYLAKSKGRNRIEFY